jgi:hypothetical protein
MFVKMNFGFITEIIRWLSGPEAEYGIRVSSS